MKKREKKREEKTRKEQEGKDLRNSLSPARDIAAGNFPEIRTEYKNRTKTEERQTNTLNTLNTLNSGQETDDARPSSRRARAASLSPRSPRCPRSSRSPRCRGLCLALIAVPVPICRLLQRVAATGTSLAITQSLHRSIVCMLTCPAALYLPRRTRSHRLQHPAECPSNIYRPRTSTPHSPLTPSRRKNARSTSST